jgi:hypothetical protein
VDVGGLLVGDFEHFPGAGEPEELAVEFEVKRDDSFFELEPEIFAFSLDGKDALAFSYARELRGRLRFGGDGMQDVDAANLSAHD